MRVAITGASGLVGSALVRDLEEKGSEVVKMVRRAESGPNELQWDPVAQKVDATRLSEMDAVVHLSGESIGQRWTAKVRQRLRTSRVDSTRFLCETISKLRSPPRIFCCASAIGIYGDRREEVLTEASLPGTGFLADLCTEWEDQTKILDRLPIRTVRMRFGVILSRQGGALAQMLPIFKRGLGGVVGSGQQYMSWISLDDVTAGIRHCLSHRDVFGPVNVTSPAPVTNKEFTNTLGRALNRSTYFWVPGIVARMAMGEMAKELLLSSARVLPRKLEESGFRFKHQTLEAALHDVLESVS